MLTGTGLFDATSRIFQDGTVAKTNGSFACVCGIDSHVPNGEWFCPSFKGSGQNLSPTLDGKAFLFML